MSGHGYWELQMEQERQKQLLLQMQGMITQNILAMKNLDPEIVQMDSEEFGRILETLTQSSQSSYPNVDKTFENVNNSIHDLTRVINESKSKLNNWNEEQLKAETAWFEIEQKTKEIEKINQNEIKNEIQKIKAQFSNLSDYYSNGNWDQLLAEKDSFCEECDQLILKSVDESVRKTVILHLISILKELGFTVAKPTKETMANGSSKVLLKGQMPSGELVTFRIDQKGITQFDMYNYHGTAHQEKLEEIIGILEEKTQGKVEIKQVVWQNPDLIKKGAKQLPRSSPDGDSPQTRSMK